MTSQQMRFIDFVETVKKRRYRPPNPHDLTDTRPITSNFGNKLNRYASQVQEGRLNVPKLGFTEEVEFNGYKRRIISRNPLLFDEDGDVIEIESEDDPDEVDAAPIEENPYEDIKIEEILRPLTSASDLPNHPSMSRVYKEKGLPEMIRKAQEALHKEQKLLAQLRQLFIRFRGDQDWLPVEKMGTDYDDWLLSIAKGRNKNQEQEEDTEPTPLALGWSGDEGKEQQDQQQNNTAMEGTEATDGPSEALNGEVSKPRKSVEQNGVENGQKSPHANSATSAGANGDPVDITTLQQTETATTESGTLQAPTEDTAMEETSPPQRMTTRALAAAPQQSSQSPSPTTDPPIHPFYIPAGQTPSHPEPKSTEEDPMIALLQYISKQEEIVRLWEELNSGLLKGLRMRDNVFRWCKADGHVGEMSDGEDWVDLEEWGLEEGELIKGKEEDENDNANEVVVSGRRGRRGGRAGAGDR